ncbi:DUF4037 domain-containing protein [Allonocardiopsis opalescens]|uniref:Uncharacterized protein DUF4037 n=1 Tax=Allonocardiopsis opalescens TaxID=1144618 RepID=A0A2T0PS83_9ACTN|nr:DUF4037 domain-containing protein [Allonocardiopsis opalescens]PRX91762.1 uncharacterized protein DUF4037 [Allonocardiopsis opalescens]
MATSVGGFAGGVEVARALFGVVAPVLARELPGLRYAAARVGGGSEVLGFDTERSVDHDWGPRLELFLRRDELLLHRERIRRVLSERLPASVAGWSTNFRMSEDPLDPVGFMAPAEGPVNHRVEVLDTGAWAVALLGVDAVGGEPTVLEWLAMPQQRLAEVTGGAVFHDSVGELTLVRSRLEWYPDEVWRYLLACQWRRVGQEEAFVGRCAEVGDELGASVVAARLVRELMRLCLLIERRYAPYSKWLGSAFGRLELAERVGPSLRGAVVARDQRGREGHLCDAYEAVGAAQNGLGLAEPVDPTRRRFHNRPYLVLGADRFARALAATLTDPQLRALPLTGAVDQWADSTDLLAHPAAIRAAMEALDGTG